MVFQGKPIRSRLAAGLLCLALSACQAAKPQTATVLAQPTTPVVKNITSFTHALRCMDQLFLAYGKRDIKITASGFTDPTNQIPAGTMDMMITTLSRMSEKSNAFAFVDIDPNSPVKSIQDEQNYGYRPPSFYIRAAITQVDKSVAADRKSMGASLPFASLGLSDDQTLSIITIDMNLGDVKTRQFIQGLNTTNTITVVNRGSSADSEAIIKKASLFFEMSQERNQGTHQSVRTLIELSLIELLGKLTRVPYWRCLEMNATDPTVIQQARVWYDEIAEPERVRLIQAALAQTGHYGNAPDGQMGPAFREAINRYKAENDLIADGRIDFDLYYKLLVDNRAVVRVDTTKSESAGLPSPGGQSPVPRPPGYGDNEPGRDPIGLKIRHVRGDDRAVSVGDKLSFAISVQRSADVYCYYEYVEGEDYHVTRIFPNRWQSNARLNPGHSVTVPAADAPFQIAPQVSDVDEQVACIASEKGYSPKVEPAALRDPDLAPLRTARRMFQVIDQHLQADRFGSTVQHLRWKVR